MIGNNISNIRKRRGYTLSELAERAGISKSYLSNIERNVNQNPSVNLIERIAIVLNVDLKILLNGENVSSDQTDENYYIEFINELKNLGIDKNQIHQYKSLIEFIKWKNEGNPKRASNKQYEEEVK